MKDLIEFLKSLVMTTVLLDKKYRETIPEIMSEMNILVESSGEEEAKRKRKPKKLKLGKNGLYPTEEEHVKRWWSSNKPLLRDDHSSTDPNETRYHITRLRTRETQLQMIIILEILALEAVAPAENSWDSQLPGIASEPTQEATTEIPSKKRKKHNLPFLLDMHADRLCIWQSTALDEVMVFAQSRPQDAQKSDRHWDPLKDFCVDIILPL